MAKNLCEWVPDPLTAGTCQHLDGIPWHERPVPRWWHLCRPVTRGILDGQGIERCACGATRIDGRFWVGKNETRRAK